MFRGFWPGMLYVVLGITMFLTEFSYFSPNEHRSDKVSFAEDTKYIYAKKVNCIIITTEYAVQ